MKFNMHMLAQAGHSMELLASMVQCEQNCGVKNCYVVDKEYNALYADIQQQPINRIFKHNK